MAGKVFFSVTMSLDGFMAPEAVPVDLVFSPVGQDDPSVQRWMTKWSQLQASLFPQRWFRENLKLGEGGEEGLDNDVARTTYERTGGAETIQQYLDSGLIDEFSITLAPVLFGTGIRLFDRVDSARLALDQVRADASSRVTHLTYTVGKP
ncbi:MAG TPA: dihydrofolate reductase family protein [Micromonosporaceae bacterium]|jgi:hypothetical protein